MAWMMVGSSRSTSPPNALTAKNSLTFGASTANWLRQLQVAGDQARVIADDLVRGLAAWAVYFRLDSRCIVTKFQSIIAKVRPARRRACAGTAAHEAAHIQRLDLGGDGALAREDRRQLRNGGVISRLSLMGWIVRMVSLSCRPSNSASSTCSNCCQVVHKLHESRCADDVHPFGVAGVFATEHQPQDRVNRLLRQMSLWLSRDAANDHRHVERPSPRAASAR